MVHFDARRVDENCKDASTDDLLLRATAFRTNMEPQALTIILKHLWQRGITAEIIAHLTVETTPEDYLRDKHGTILRCSHCEQPAIRQVWGWHRFWGFLPILPRKFRFCREHSGG
jgi:hypothetical protein